MLKMYLKTEKKFVCNHCQKEITAGDPCWMKTKFPEKATKAQLKPIKTLEFENAPLLCLACATKLIQLID